MAASGAGFDLDGIALRGRGEPVQLRWRRRAFLREEAPPEDLDPQDMKEALHGWLVSRGEPAPYLHLHAVGLSLLEEEHGLKRTNETASWHQAQVQAPLAEPLFHHYSDSPNMETGLWSLAKWEPGETLSDRVEILLVRHLQKNPGLSYIDLETELNNSFPGLMTPGSELIHSILDSYAEEKDSTWTVRLVDTPSRRMMEMDAASRHLQDFSARLGFTCNKEEDTHLLQWMEAGQVAYSFHILASTVTGRLFHSSKHSSGQSILVLPADRIRLLTYKLAHDPSLQVEAETWNVLSFEKLESMDSLPGLSRETWQQELAGSHRDNLEQLKLF